MLTNLTRLLPILLLAACMPANRVTPHPLNTAVGAATMASPSATSVAPATVTPGPAGATATATASPAARPDTTALPPLLTFWDCATAPHDCPDTAEHWLTRLSVPSGFEVAAVGRLPDIFAPTAITYGPDGRLYVAVIPRPFEEGFLGAIMARNGAGEWELFADKLWLPAGLAFAPDGSRLYVSSRAGRFEGKVSAVEPDGRVVDIAIGLPCCYSAAEHQPNGLVFGPDGWLYVGIGARSDHGEPAWGETEARLHPLEAGILRLRPNGLRLERYASGLRNPYGLDFDLFGQLWADDNGPDFGPPDRLHRIEAGQHYGFPYYDDCADCPAAPAGLEIIPPYVEFPPHATPAGLAAYKGLQFPLSFINSIFVALWNPGPGGSVVRVHGDRQVDNFVTGLWGPVDVTIDPDGALVVADHLSGYLFAVRWIGD